ncbi:MAG: heme synthase [Nevskia sp.]|nr:heme synthase [Nevskia sp.]
MFYRLNLLTVALCYALVVLGAFVRLSDAGLGCPDWPGCYGQIAVPQAEHAVDRAQAAFPQRPLEAHKAWKEMIHRYLAGIVGLLIAALAVLAWRTPGGPRGLASAVVLVVLAQIVFGALTVTMQVNPLIVTTHLLLGLTTLSLLWWMWLGGLPRQTPPITTGLRRFAAFGLIVLLLQIFLGGWTSTNYAALSCPDFPTCLGSFAPATALSRAFTLWHGSELNYEYGILDVAARATVHLVHRYGALLVTLVLGALALRLLSRSEALWRRLGTALIGALLLQLAIGIGLVELQLPLWLADAHNAGAALLLLTVLAVNHFVWRTAPQARIADR